MHPTISLITPVYQPPASVLRQTIQSVLDQQYPHWQLCLFDDASTDPTTRQILNEFQGIDPRIIVGYGDHNQGIAAASNSAMALAIGSWLGFLDHDDVLAPQALQRVAETIDQFDDVDLIYSDEDKVTMDGRFVSPIRRPPWSPERLRNQNYICHFVAARAQAVTALGGFRAGFDGSQDHDLLLRLSETARRIVHIPEILYHWRMVEGSVAHDSAAKPYAYDAGRRAVQEHCDRTGIAATVSIRDRAPGCYRVHRQIEQTQTISVIIPSNGTSGRVHGITTSLVVNLVQSIAAETAYPIAQIVVVDDVNRPLPHSARESILDVANGSDISIVSTNDATFNFSRQINVGAAHCDTDLLLLLNDDVYATEPNWLDEMVSLLGDDVGAVAPFLHFPEGMLQCAGHNHSRAPEPDGRLKSSRYRGSQMQFAATREVSSVSGACMLTRRSTFYTVGGMNTGLPGAYNDVDYCIKLRRYGLRVLVTPNANLVHLESASRDPRVAEREYVDLMHRWRADFGTDLYDPDGPARGQNPILNFF